MKLWLASDSSIGAWYDVTEINPMAHGRAETGEILRYYENDKETFITAYYWDSIKAEYRKTNI